MLIASSQKKNKRRSKNVNKNVLRKDQQEIDKQEIEIIVLDKELEIDPDPDCLICLEPSQPTNKLLKMKDFILFDSYCQCNGNFHIKCLFDWIKVSKTCPICRANLTINLTILNQLDQQYKKYNIVIAECKEHIKFFFNMCYGVIMIMTKYMMIVYLINIFISIMKALFELSLKKAQ